MQLRRKVDNRRAANSNPSARKSQKILTCFSDLALTNVGLSDKTASLTFVAVRLSRSSHRSIARYRLKGCSRGR